VAPPVGVGAEGEPARAGVVGREAVAGGEVRGLAHRQDAFLGVAVLRAHDRHPTLLWLLLLLPGGHAPEPELDAGRACLLASGVAAVCSLRGEAEARCSEILSRGEARDGAVGGDFKAEREMRHCLVLKSEKFSVL